MDATPAPARPARGTSALSVALFVLVLGLYLPSGHFSFVEYDDPGYVRDNPHLAEGLSGSSVAWAFTSTDYQYNWHPLTWLSHALDVELFGRAAAGPQHLVNVVLHGLVAAVLFLALLALTREHWLALFAAALFAVHPLRVESVAWISERKDLLAGLGFALTLLAYAHHARAPGPRSLAVVAGALVLGLLAKPTLVTLPALLLVLDGWPLGRLGREPLRRLLGEKLLLLVPCVLVSLLTVVAQRTGGALNSAIDLGERLENAPLAYLTYLRQLVWPFELAVFYPHPALLDPQGSRAGAALLASLVLAALLALAWRLRARAPALWTGLVWFLGVLVPMIGLVQVGNLAHADRYMYLAGIGPELALAAGTLALARTRPALARPLALGAVLVLAALFARSRAQLGVWRDSRTLFEHALAVTERNWVAHNQLGLVLGQAGDPAAVEHFEAARTALPGFFEAELNLGKARYALAEYAAARAALERALSVRPTSGEARLCLAFVLVRLDSQDAARDALEQALRDEPALHGDSRVARLRQLLEEAPR